MSVLTHVQYENIFTQQRTAYCRIDCIPAKMQIITLHNLQMYWVTQLGSLNRYANVAGNTIGILEEVYKCSG